MSLVIITFTNTFGRLLVTKPWAESCPQSLSLTYVWLDEARARSRTSFLGVKGLLIMLQDGFSPDEYPLLSLYTAAAF